jgi:hypothetical protein
MNEEEAQQAIAQLQEWAKAKFGEPQYKYERYAVQWSSRDRCYMRRLNGATVTKEEYEAEKEHAEALATRVRRRQAKPSEYYEYDKTMTVPGWRERLAELVSVPGGTK